MYFDLTDDQKAIREAVDSLLQTKLDQRTLLQLYDAGTLDRDLWQSLMSLGLGSILVPKDHGGLGLDLLTLAVVAECLSHAGAPGPVLNNALASWLVATSGDEGLVRRWLEPLSSGVAIASFAFLETDGAWLPNSWTLSGPRLNGTKSCVEWAQEADLLVVGIAGGGLALVDAKVIGVEIQPQQSLDRSRSLSEVRFEEVEATPLPGADVAASLVDAVLVLLAADACGAGFRAYEMAVKYAESRSQFGQIIGKFQALKHQLANMAVDMEPCRSLYWYAAHAWDAIPKNRPRAAATAKAHIGDAAVKTARAAVEAHGGIGYTWEYPLHVFLKRAMYAHAAMGSPAVHRERMAVLAGW